jgi:hypothetical protein
MVDKNLLQRKQLPWSWRHPLKWILQQWNRARQNVDLQILWPSFKNEAEKLRCNGQSDEDVLEKAREGFLMHMSADPAWEGEFCTEEELGDFVRRYLV